VASARTWMCGLVLSDAGIAKRNGTGRAAAKQGLFGALPHPCGAAPRGVHAVTRRSAERQRHERPGQLENTSNLAEQIGEQECLDASNALPGFIIGNRQGRTRFQSGGELNRIGGSKAVACAQGRRI
jgi:hypothetical protein